MLLNTVLNREAKAAREELRTLITNGTYLNEAFLSYADAVAAGRLGDQTTAEAMFTRGRSRITIARGSRAWRYVAERLVADCALRDGWGQPIEWLTHAAAFFGGRDCGHLERSSRSLCVPPAHRCPAVSELIHRSHRILRAWGSPNERLMCSASSPKG